MANHNHTKCCPLNHALIFILSCTGVMIVGSARPTLSFKTSQNSPAYPQIHDFPSLQLYHAYFVIQRFKSTITCDPKNITSTWTGHDICGKKSYIGFYCATQSGGGNNLTVTSAIFNGFGLCAPKLQGFIDQLPDLALFQPTSSKFGGDVPGQLADLSKTNNHDVPDGRPGQFSESKYDPLGGTRHSLVTINGRGIKVSMPGDLIYTARHLDKLKVEPVSPPSTSSNKFGFQQMSYLALANNKLTGPIPPSIGHLQDSLLEVLLLNNQLSGCLPHELGMLHKVAVIDAGMNQLTGPIPSSFSCLSSVEQLNLAGNSLHGDVPDALCKLGGPAGHLANLTLSGNYFTSVGPACAALIKDGVLDVKNNCIPGLANQRRPAECAAFQSQQKGACPAATTQVTCPAAAATNAAAPGERKARNYSSYVTYATLHE